MRRLATSDESQDDLSGAEQDELVRLATERYGSSDIQIDSDAAFSWGVDGVWVSGWLFLSNEEIGRDEEDDDAQTADS
jgi:hypothetical protein